MRRRLVHLTRTGPLRPERCGHPPGFDTRCFPTIDLHSHALLDCAVDGPAGSCLSPTSRTREALRCLRPVSLAHATRPIARRAGLPRRTLKAQVCPAGCFAALFGVLTHPLPARQALLRTKESRAGPRYVLRLPLRRNHPQSLHVFPSGSTAGHPPGHASVN